MPTEKEYQKILRPRRKRYGPNKATAAKLESQAKTRKAKASE